MVVFLCIREHPLDPRDAIRRGPLESDVVRIMIGNHLVIGGGDEAFLRIEKIWQFADRYEASPIETACAGHGKKASPFADGSEPGRVFPNVALGVRVNEILGRHFPARNRRFELIPVLRAVEGEGGKVSGGAGFASYPAQGEGA